MKKPCYNTNNLERKPMLLEGYLSVVEAANKLGIHPVTMRLWCTKSKVDFVKRGSRYFIKEADLPKLIENHPANSESHIIS